VGAREIFVRYVLFAVIAGAANLSAQELTIRALPTLPVAVSVLVGTGAGFLVKYALDKRWIFFDAYESHATEIRKIAIYGVSGVATTLVFWGAELGAWTTWRTPEAKYAGAVVGLALGNWIKYRLDKHYVFGAKS
jgi:putative flippase GtrA